MGILSALQTAKFCQTKRSCKWQQRWEWLFCSRRSRLCSCEDLSGFKEDLTRFFFL